MSISGTSTTSNQETIQQIIDGTSLNSGLNKRNTGDLGKTDFLNLLITQLRYQDPLNPTNDKEFIGQMAQFNALEQMQNLNENFSIFRSYSLLGKNVSAVVRDNSNNVNTLVTGEVTSVKVKSGTVYVVVNNKEISIDDITEISDATNEQMSNLSQYTSLIGCSVSGIAYDPTTGDMLKIEGIVKGLQAGLYEDYAILDGVKANVAGIYNSASNDTEFVKNQLQQAVESGEKIDIVIRDIQTGKSVPVTVLVESFEISEDGEITGVLNQLAIPVDGITRVNR